MQKGVLNLGWISRELSSEKVENFNRYLSLLGPKKRARGVLISRDNFEIQLNGVFHLNLKKMKDWVYQIQNRGAGLGIRPSLVRFAFQLDTLESRLLVTTGANRNAMLLFRGFSPFLVFDDDVRPEVKRLCSGVDSILEEHDSQDWQNIYRYRFFRSRHDLETFLEECNPIRFSEFCHQMDASLRSFSEGPECKPALVTCGFFGDIAASSPRIIHALRGDELMDLRNSGVPLEEMLESRLVFRQPEKRVRSAFGQLMMPAVGINGDLDLPPFFPIGRNQDGAYASTLLSCSDDLKTLHLPYAVAHNPYEVRRNIPFSRKTVFRVNDILILLWNYICVTSPESRKGVKEVGKKLGELCQSSPRQWRDLTLFLTENLLRSRIEGFQFKRTRPEFLEFPEWQNLIQNEILAMELALKDEERIVPKEVRVLRVEAKGSPLERGHFSQCIQEWFRKYSELLQVWPEFRKCAAEYPVDQGYEIEA